MAVGPSDASANIYQIMSCWFQETARFVRILNLTTLHPPFFLLEAYSIGDYGTPTKLQAMDWSIRTEQSATYPCPIFCGKSWATPSEDISLTAVTFIKNKVSSSYKTMPKEREALRDGHWQCHCVAQDGSSNQWQQVWSVCWTQIDRAARVNGKPFKDVELFTVRRHM